MSLVGLEVGKPWPYPIPGEGLQALLEPGEDGPQMMLLAAVSRPTPKEVSALRKQPLRLAVLPSPPIVWIALDAGAISLDAPYAIGLGGSERAAALKSSAGMAEAWPENSRGLVTVALVDTDTALIRVLRVVSLSRSWWLALTRGLSACPDDTRPAERDAAVIRDMTRWTTADMIASATAVETAGAV